MVGEGGGGGVEEVLGGREEGEVGGGEDMKTISIEPLHKYACNVHKNDAA